MRDRFQISIDNIVHYLKAISTLSNNIRVLKPTIDPLYACLIIISFDLIFVISEFNRSLMLNVLSEVLFILILVCDKFLHMVSNSSFSLVFDVTVDVDLF